MRCCLVVTTQEWPDALARVLASIEVQTRPPDELVVADDGSGPVTAELVSRAARRLPCPVRHAWQPNEGFRAGRIRNVAIADSECDYVLLLDGDMVVHPAFVADHLALARPGRTATQLCRAHARRRPAAAPGRRRSWWRSNPATRPSGATTCWP